MDLYVVSLRADTQRFFFLASTCFFYCVQLIYLYVDGFEAERISIHNESFKNNNSPHRLNTSPVMLHGDSTQLL